MDKDRRTVKTMLGFNYSLTFNFKRSRVGRLFMFLTVREGHKESGLDSNTFVVCVPSLQNK